MKRSLSTIDLTDSIDIDPSAGGSTDDMRVINRKIFNNVEIRTFLCFPPPKAVPNFPEFYLNVTNGFQLLLFQGLLREQGFKQMTLSKSIYAPKVCRMVSQ